MVEKIKKTKFVFSMLISSLIMIPLSFFSFGKKDSNLMSIFPQETAYADTPVTGDGCGGASGGGGGGGSGDDGCSGAGGCC
ncbi:hypothetical protein K9M47_03400 [Candidatus Gracilibacteria bacterium]|nr:hypothetical protein [Candidatus Gracilibacteria bacterium]MCF7898485.1 hypothetical protein [Candidatus Paceibacterota bacterium]